MTYFKVPSQNMTGEPEENYESPEMRRYSGRENNPRPPER